MEKDIFENRYSENEVAALLGVSAMTVRRYRERGELKFYKLGHRIFIGQSQIADFLERNEKNGDAETK